MQICSAKIIAETDKFFYKKYNYKLAEQYRYNKRETVNLIVTEKLFFIDLIDAKPFISPHKCL